MPRPIFMFFSALKAGFSVLFHPTNRQSIREKTIAVQLILCLKSSFFQIFLKKKLKIFITDLSYAPCCKDNILCFLNHVFFLKSGEKRLRYKQTKLKSSPIWHLAGIVITPSVFNRFSSNRRHWKDNLFTFPTRSWS